MCRWKGGTLGPRQSHSAIAGWVRIWACSCHFFLVGTQSDYAGSWWLAVFNITQVLPCENEQTKWDFVFTSFWTSTKSRIPCVGIEVNVGERSARFELSDLMITGSQKHVYLLKVVHNQYCSIQAGFAYINYFTLLGTFEITGGLCVKSEELC
jgi:hypothetical protein